MAFDESADPHNDASTGGQSTDETSQWPSNTEEGSSEERSSMNHAGFDDDPSTSEKVETNKTVTSEISDASQLPLDATPPPKENKTKHSVATALDGTRLKCAKCENIQEEVFDLVKIFHS